jgi:hypothetical protein
VSLRRPVNEIFIQTAKNYRDVMMSSFENLAKPQTEQSDPWYPASSINVIDDLQLQHKLDFVLDARVDVNFDCKDQGRLSRMRDTGTIREAFEYIRNMPAFLPYDLDDFKIKCKNELINIFTSMANKYSTSPATLTTATAATIKQMTKLDSDNTSPISKLYNEIQTKMNSMNFLNDYTFDKITKTFNENRNKSIDVYRNPACVSVAKTNDVSGVVSLFGSLSSSTSKPEGQGQQGHQQGQTSILAGIAGALLGARTNKSLTTQTSNQTTIFPKKINSTGLSRCIEQINVIIDMETQVRADCFKNAKSEHEWIETALSKVQGGGGLNDPMIPSDTAMSYETAKRHGRVVERYYERMRGIAKKYFDFHVQSFRRQGLHFAIRYEKSFPPDFSNPRLDEFRKKRDELKSRGTSFFLEFIRNMNDKFDIQDLGDFDLSEIDPDAKATMSNARDSLMAAIELYPENIAALYNNEMSLSLMMDTSFFILTGLKLIRLGITSLSLSIASKLFEDTYMVQVYTQNKAPPSMYTLLAYFIGIDIAINAAIVLILFVAMFANNLPSVPSVFDDTLIRRFVVDYVISSSILVLIFVIISGVVTNKKYFRYDLEGPRAIRAVKEIIFKVAAVLTFVPFHLVG